MDCSEYVVLWLWSRSGIYFNLCECSVLRLKKVWTEHWCVLIFTTTCVDSVGAATLQPYQSAVAIITGIHGAVGANQLKIMLWDISL